MSLGAIDFREDERDDPFLSGFERLEKRANGDLAGHVCSHYHDGRFQRTRLQMRALGENYYPVPRDIGVADQRGESLTIGMLIGLYAGVLSIPRLAMPHYLEHLQMRLSHDAGEFRGYHSDISSMEDSISRRYLEDDLRARLPHRGYIFLDEILHAGFGWVATRTAEYHAEALSLFSARALWHSRNEYRRLVKAELSWLRSQEVLVLEQPDGI